MKNKRTSTTLPVFALLGAVSTGSLATGGEWRFDYAGGHSSSGRNQIARRACRQPCAPYSRGECSRHTPCCQHCSHQLPAASPQWFHEPAPVESDAVFHLPAGHEKCCSDDRCGECNRGNGCNACDNDGEPCNYGPHPCRSRGTLLQWSYGTSFSGGPDLDEPLVTDRPDFTEASSTVGEGVAQLEFGYTYTYDTEGNISVREHSIGEPLLRYGVFADWLELRFFLPPLQESITMGGTSMTTTGTGDLGLGLKIALTPQEGVLPEMALIPQMNVPTGSAAFSSDSVEPGLNWVYSWEVSDFFTAAGSTQANRRIDGTTGDGFVEVAQSWTAGLSWTEKLGSYIEWFYLVPSGADTEKTRHFLNGGVTYLISNDVQFDVRVGRGLNGNAEDYFAGTGLSIRFQ